MTLKRTNVHLEKETMPELKKIAKEIRYWGVSASDLIRYALKEVYGLPFNTTHVWVDRLKEGLKKYRSKQKSK